MTITSVDTIGISSGTAISMSELRTYFGQSGSVSLNATFNGGTNPVPSSLPGSGAETSFSDYYDTNRILKKKGTTETKTSGTSWSPAQTGCVQYNVYVLGGGGSGGGASTDSGREKVASGAGAGGVAFRRYSTKEHSITSATIAIGAGATGISYSASSGVANSGRNGGTTSFNPDGSGTTISATGGSRGFGSRQGTAGDTPDTTGIPGENSTGTLGGQWGGCAESAGGTGSGGESNYTGGNGTGFSIGGDASAASGGGSPNLGSGGVNGSTVSQSGYAKSATTGAPTKPSEWGSDVTVTFQGGAAVQHSSGAAGASDAGNNYGAGSGGSASESGAGSTGDGSQGAIFVTYYEINT